MNDPVPPDDEATLGLLLAGGRSTRMRGMDKALAKVHGQPLIAYAWDRLSDQCRTTAVSVNRDPERFAVFGAPLLPDDPPDGAGPLAGVLAGLDYARAHTRATHVVSLPVDTPFAPRDLVSKLQAARRATGAEIVTARSGGRAHHVVALWTVALAADLRAALVGRGVRRVESFTSGRKTIQVDWPIGDYDPFFNVNTPEDLVRAEAIVIASIALAR